ncbi:MAG: Na+:solute symporter [Alphaproteobacteria bacterium]|nr:Na+:solute symporter [Alphaproteobacteria bacterium]
MSTLDYAVILAYLIGALLIGVAVSRRASRSSEEYFVAGRSLPWWLAGTSMVATTFAADTPLAITGFVANSGIAGNWIWWSVGIAHVLAAVVWARWWRRLSVVTDAEVLELRYTGRPAAALRLIKAGYQSIFFNVLVIGWVIVAMRKVSLALFPDQDPLAITFGLMGLAVLYSLLGGMRSVVLTDLIQFALAMLGALLLMVFAAREVGGVSGLTAGLAEVYPERAQDILSFVPAGDLPGLPMSLFAVLMTIAWWRSAEGGGYIVQRLGACRDARDAERAGLWFAVMHNAIRPWPWILVGLAALLVWPLEAGPCQPGCPADYACVEAVCVVPDREATYPMMMARLMPPGLLGLMVASLLAAFMSTIDTHVNWGASYVVRDVWERFFAAPDEDPHVAVRVGRLAVVVVAALGAGASLFMDSIGAVWLFVLMLGSGLGSVSLARWLWWRVNAQAELVALAASSLLSAGVVLLGNTSLPLIGENPLFVQEIPQATRFLIVSLGSLACWIPTALLTSPDPQEKLLAFYRAARPLSLGWGPVRAEAGELPASGAGAMALRLAAGGLAVFGTLFGLGGLLLRGPAWGLLAAAGLAAWVGLLLRAEPEPMED